MKYSPLVSIVMPCFNSGDTILESINSVISQTYSNWELLIVDDCSNDRTLEYIQSITDIRVKYFVLETNSGSPAKPRNIALNMSNGAYIAFLDSDDVWYPTKLEKQIKFMVDNDLAFSCTAYDIFDEEKDLQLCTYIPPLYSNHSDLLACNSIGCLTAVLKKSSLGQLRFPLCGHEDYALWLKLIKKTGGVFALLEPLACYRKVQGSVSSNKLKLILFYWNIYRREENMSMIKSILCCFRYFVNVLWFKYR